MKLRVRRNSEGDLVLEWSLDGIHWEAPTMVERFGMLRLMRLVDRKNNAKTIRRTGRCFFDMWIRGILIGRSLEKMAASLKLGPLRTIHARLVDKAIEKLKANDLVGVIDYNKLYEEAKRRRSQRDKQNEET